MFITEQINSTHPIVDLVRIITVFIPAAIIAGSVAMVIFAYYKAYRIDKFKGARAGLLPHHVWTIAISYMLLIIDEILVVFERKGSDISIHTFLLAPAFILGVIAMYLVLRFERLRYSVTKSVNSDIDSDEAVMNNNIADA